MDNTAAFVPSKTNIDKTLENQRQRLRRRACYPCSSRKVKCDRTTPCRMCVQRGHPEICIPGDHVKGTTLPREPARNRRSRLSPSTSTSAADPSAPSRMTRHLAEADETLEDLTPMPAPAARDVVQPSFLGQKTLPSIVGTTPHSRSTPSDDMRQALGLQNTWQMYPYMQHTSMPAISEEVDRLVPSHAEILKYSQCYQSLVWPFYPHVADLEDLETLICTYLESSSIRRSSGRPIFSGPIRQSDIARSSLLLAILASGVHFSDHAPNQRKLLSQEYARKAFHCARLSNFLLRPTLDSVQALLVLGHVLQNNGQADASWSLLGTTIRLAESLGLHSDRAALNLTPEMLSRRTKIWQCLLWQDSLLSLSFDRIPSSHSSDLASILPSGKSLSYVECMYLVSAIARDLLEKPRGERAGIDTMQHYLQQLDQVKVRSQPHLKTLLSCTSRQARMEHHAFRLQQAFGLSFVCRPVVSALGIPATEAALSFIHERAREALLETLRAFMALQTLTILPLRSWSMIHAAISAALVLQLQGEAGCSDEATNLQNDLVDALTRECSETGGSDTAQAQPWLSTAHLRALRTLQDSLKKRSSESASVVAMLDSSQNYGPANSLPADIFGGHEMPDLVLDDYGNIDWGFDLYGTDFDNEHLLF